MASAGLLGSVTGDVGGPGGPALFLVTLSFLFASFADGYQLGPGSGVGSPTKGAGTFQPMVLQTPRKHM